MFTVNEKALNGQCLPIDQSRGFLCLPLEIIQIVMNHLNHIDLLALSRTCRILYNFVNQNPFWFYRIRHQFSTSIVSLYTSALFEKPEIVPSFNEIRPSNFQHVRSDDRLNMLGIHAATHYNDEAIQRRQAKMFVSQEDFIDQLEFYQFKQPKHKCEIPLMKLIYFYLIDRKCLAVVDMNLTSLNAHFLVKTDVTDSFKGQVIVLQDALRLEIVGHFEYKIMPGKYRVTWRMQLQPDLLAIEGETQFVVVPQYGRLLKFTMFTDDFRNLSNQHQRQWFHLNVGETVIYEPSNVFVAILNTDDHSHKRGISWDCVRLTVVP